MIMKCILPVREDPDVKNGSAVLCCALLWSAVVCSVHYFQLFVRFTGSKDTSTFNCETLIKQQMEVSTNKSEFVCISLNCVLIFENSVGRLMKK